MAYEVKKSDVYKTGYKYGDLAGVGPTQAGVYKSGYKYGNLASSMGRNGMGDTVTGFSGGFIAGVITGIGALYLLWR
jgi:hypothetical protein